jgi:hypothetical protein
MAIPAQLSAIIEQINRDLVEIELEATEGLNLSRRILAQFPNNARLIQFFASFSSAILFLDIETIIIEKKNVIRIEAIDCTARTASITK